MQDVLIVNIMLKENNIARNIKCPQKGQVCVYKLKGKIFNDVSS